MFRPRLKVITGILGRRKYLLFTGTVFAALIFLTVWLPNLSLLKTIILSPRLSSLEKISFLKFSLLTFGTASTPVSRILTVIVIILISLNLSLTIFYLSRRRGFLKSSRNTGLPAVIFGLIGIGCAGCGSFLLSSLGLASAVGLLPLKGLEFSLVSLLLLVFSLNQLLTAIDREGLCSLKTNLEKNTAAGENNRISREK